jgi:hypothetical protein
MTPSLLAVLALVTVSSSIAVHANGATVAGVVRR